MKASKKRRTSHKSSRNLKHTPRKVKSPRGKAGKKKSLFPLPRVTGISIFPNRLQVTLPWALNENYGLTGTGLTFTNFQRFYLNSAYDPDQETALTGQPYGFDQVKQFYNYYRVIAVEYTCVIRNVSDFGVNIGWALGTGGSGKIAGLTIEDAMVQPFVGIRRLSNIDRGTAPRNSGSEISWSGRVNVKKQMARWFDDPATKWNANYAAVGSNPPSLLSLYLGYLKGPETLTGNPSVNVTFKMRQLIEFINPVRIDDGV